MSFDPHKNFAYSTVATAPSPATSGTSLDVAAGDGTLFPDPGTDGDFNVTVWPAGAIPTEANAEICRVTARSTDTLTITRAQESTSARAIQAGDQIALTITKKLLDDIEAAISGGAVTEADLSLSDVATDDVSSSKHGFAPKAPGDASKFLDGTGNYSTPGVPVVENAAAKLYAAANFV